MPFCPNCKYEYNPGVTVCPDCDAKLVDKLPEEPKQELIDEELVCVAKYPSEMDAQEAKLRLESFGIRSIVEGTIPASVLQPLLLAGGGVKLMVLAGDLAAARKALEGD